MDKKSRIWVIVLALLLAVALVLLVVFKLRIDRLVAAMPAPEVTQEPVMEAEPTAAGDGVDMDAISERIAGLAGKLTELQLIESDLQKKIDWLEYEIEFAGDTGSEDSQENTAALNDAEKALSDVGCDINDAESAIYSAKNNIAVAGAALSAEKYAEMTADLDEAETELGEIAEGLETVESDVSTVMNDLGLTYPGDGNWQSGDEYAELMMVLEALAADCDYYYSELENMTAERDGLVTELETVTAERDDAVAELETVTAERDDAVTELETVTAERDDAVTELETVTAERDDAVTELETVTAERDGFETEVEQLRTDLDTAGSEKTELAQQLDDALALLDKYTAADETLYHASAELEDVVVVAADGVSAEYSLVNNNESGNNIRCEFALDGEVIYTSGDIAPGGSLEPFVLDNALEPGEYSATVTVITLNADGEISSRMSMPVTITVED